jgi:C1A family cysteine protease
MDMRYRNRTLLLILSVLLASGGLHMAGAGSDNPLRAQLAPLSADYVRYLNELRTGRIPGYASGLLVPSPQDLRHLNSLVTLEANALPAVYDLRLLNKMTPVRNEGTSGGSLAFAALASLESSLKPLETWDLSEHHLLSSLAGDKFFETVVGALARWADPVRESDDPWPADLEAGMPTVKHVQNVTFLPPRTGPLDNDRLKQAIMDSGAIYAEMMYSPALLNASTAAYYDAATEGTELARAVAVAGWDDTFDKSRFNPQPPGNGAFICKNSFGSAWGNAGYFYVSYYDGFFARRGLSAAFKAEPLSGYVVNYQYDINGCTDRLGFGTDTAWFANLFTATTADPLTAVSFYTYSPSTLYEVTVYKNPIPGQPVSGTGIVRVTGTLVDAGYSTIPLRASVALLPNDRFSVVVKLQTSGDLFPIPVEHPIAGVTAPFTANPGESFISADGGEWSDLTTYKNGAFSRTNVCLKAFAGYAPIYPPASLRVERLTNNFFFFREYVDKLSWDANPNNSAVPVRYRIYRKAQGAAAAEFQYLGETQSDFRYFFIRSVKKTDSFFYRVTAVMADGRESDPAEISI